MIIPPFFFLILAILPTITKQQQSPVDDGPSGQVKPAWTDEWCDNQIICLCLQDLSQPILIQVFTPTPANCVTGVQSRYFTEDLAVFQFQVTEDQSVLGKKLMIHRENEEVFGCEIDGKSGKVVLTAPAALIKDFDLALFEDRSRFEQGFSLCALQTTRAPQLENFMKVDRKYSTILKQSMTLITTDEESIEYSFRREVIGHIFYDRYEYKCDPYSFNDQLYSSDYHALPIRKRDRDILNCKNYGDSYDIRYERNGIGMKNGRNEGTEKNKPIKELKCAPEKSLNAQYAPAFIYYIVYEPVDGETPPDDKPLTDVGTYSFVCAAKFEEVCVLPELGCEQGTDDCPVYTPGKKGKRAELTCPGKKWLVKGEYYVIAENAVCSYQKRAQNEAAFILTLPTGVEIEARGEEFRCFTDYDCMKKSPIAIPSTAVNNDGVVTCKNSTINLRIRDYGAKTTLSASTFACDKSSGEWRNTTSGAMTEPIRGGSQITCPENGQKFKNQSKAKLTESQIYAIIVGSGFAIFCVAMIISFAVRYCIMHRRHQSIDAQAFLKKTRAERLEHCRKFFPEVLKTSTTSAVHINNGLMELDMLLNLEIEDPEIWNLVYPFLMRVHGTIRRVDKQCWHMLTRYLYLQAKKIIDKHGWFSPKPITRNSQKGTIRAVAINLLTFALADPRNKRKSEKLLLNGARKLGFRMNEQYPHCGVLLSVLSYARVNCKVVNKAGRSRHLRMDDYLKILEEIATKSTITIPEYEVIPAFGSVAQQAAFACGGVQMLGFHIEHSRVLTLEKLVEGGKIAVSYVAGLSNSIYRSPAQPLLLAFRLTDRSNPYVMKHLCDVAPEADWNKTIEQALRIAVYYGRHLDAKRIEQRFMPKVTQPTAMLTGLTLDQNEFELALDFQLEELREWFAAHTDIDEFKKEPAYATTDKFKQDNRKEVVDKETTVGDGCGSEIKSGQASTQSNSTDVKSPATPEIKSSASASYDSKGKEPAALEAAPPVAAVVATSPAPATNPASSPA